MSPRLSRVARGGRVWWNRSLPISFIFLLALAIPLSGCTATIDRYALIEQSLRAGHPAQAAAIVERTEHEYGPRNLLLYWMDRGMTLHLAGAYRQSTMALDQAEEIVERLYTRTVRSEAAAFVTNDNTLPYEGDAYEHIMINVIKALNYAVQGEAMEALVEARRIDHRLNVLSDRTNDSSEYRDDGFARYLIGMLYEAAGDFNNAFVAYRNALRAYETAYRWVRIAPPLSLRAALLSCAEALGLEDELEGYRKKFPEVEWEPTRVRRQLAQVVMISYNGRAPRKEDLYLDLPIGLDALQLVLLNKGMSRSFVRQDRVVDSLVYGLNGRVVRVALPRLVPQKTRVPFETLMLTDEQGLARTVRSELVQNLTALAEKTLADRMPSITVKALARAATKFSMAEGVVMGTQQAVGRDAAPWIGLLAGLVAKGLAVASEEADKRSWLTLPDEIHMARVWVPPGRYQTSIRPLDQGTASETVEKLDLAPGQTVFLIRREIQ